MTTLEVIQSHLDSVSTRTFTQELAFPRGRDFINHRQKSVLFSTRNLHPSHQQSHFLSDLLILLSGSRAVFSLVSFFFMPSIRAQKLLRRPASAELFFACSLDTGGLRFIPCALADARPLAFRPPSGFCPSLRVHAADFFFAITSPLVLA